MGVVMSGASWTDERVQTLKKLWNEGFSAAQIARELGGVTRNTVIGKLHRIGLRREEGGSSKAKAAEPSKKKPLAGATGNGISASERNFWTREEEDALIELRNNGTPFPVITDELNKLYPQRAKQFFVQPVVAKYYYLVKVGRAKAVKTSPARAVSKAGITRIDFTQLHRTQDDFNREVRVKAMEAEARARPRHQQLTIMDLTQTTCRWPIGDPNDADFHFCGLPVARRSNGKPSSYCMGHTELAYQPAREWRFRRS